VGSGHGDEETDERAGGQAARHHGQRSRLGGAATDVPGSRLADDLPQVAELDLNPVIARPDGAHVVDMRMRILPAGLTDPYVRKLR
jgi:hypothetical protein